MKQPREYQPGWQRLKALRMSPAEVKAFYTYSEAVVTTQCPDEAFREAVAAYQGVIADSRPEEEVLDEVWYDVEWLWEVWPLDGLTWDEAVKAHLAVWGEMLGGLHLRSPAEQEGSLTDLPGGISKRLN